MLDNGGWNTRIRPQELRTGGKGVAEAIQDSYVMDLSVVCLADRGVDFKNPADPNDKSFEVHPTDYPTVELEYPNTHASERYGPWLRRPLSPS